MTRSDLQIIAVAARSSRISLLLYCICEATSILSTFGFSATLALYFHLDVFGLEEIAFLRQAPSILVATAVLAFAMALLGSRIAYTWIEASVTSRQEIQFARILRESNAMSAANRKHVGRASNHFARLASASMKAASAACILVASLFVAPFVLPWEWCVGVILAVLLCIGLLWAILPYVSTPMRRSATNLVSLAPDVAAWKQNPEVAETEAISSYQSAYFWRLFLGTVFATSPMVFSLVVSLLLLLMAAFGWSIELGEAFVGFFLVQSYLGLLGRLFSNLTAASAFLPAVARFSAQVLQARSS